MRPCRNVLTATLLFLLALVAFASPPAVLIRQPDGLSASSENPVDVHVLSDTPATGRLTASLATEDGMIVLPFASRDIELIPGDNPVQVCVTPEQLSAFDL